MKAGNKWSSVELGWAKYLGLATQFLFFHALDRGPNLLLLSESMTIWVKSSVIAHFNGAQRKRKTESTVTCIVILENRGRATDLVANADG